MPAPRSVSTETLLAESAWLRDLARHMLRDESRAEDAVQDTLAAAIERPPDGSFPPRRWLAKVLRNFVRQEHRSRARRAQREIRAAARNATPATVEVVERLALQRRVVDAVNALDEPYRTAIVLRFLDGLPPREVARRTGAPVKTVHTRVERGLAKLRIALDTEYGQRRAWSAVLIPIATPALRPIVATTGVLMMSTKMKLALSAGTVLAIGFAAYRIVPGRAASNEERVAALAPSSAEALTPDEDVHLPAASENERTVRTAPTASEPIDTAPLPEPEPRPTFEGVVVDVDGHGVGDLLVQLQPLSMPGEPDAPLREDEAPIVSGPDGRFRMPLPEHAGGLLFANGNGYGTVVPSPLNAEMPPSPPRIVVAGSRTYAGVVVDGRDVPLAGVDLAVSLPAERAFELSGSTFMPPLRRAQSDEAGTFRFDRLGFVPGTSLKASLEGFRSTSLALADNDRSDLRITLQRIEPGQVIFGEVVDEHGVGVTGAWVGLDTRTARTDERGSFVIEVGDETDGILRAVCPRYLPTEYALELDAGGRIGEPGPIVLALGGRSLSLSGHVVDARGDTVVGAQVWTFDGTLFGHTKHRAGQIDLMINVDVETLMAGAAPMTPGGREAVTDDRGRFELTGLLDRTYAIFAMNPTTMEMAGLEARAGATDLVLRLSEEQLRRVAGRVVTYAGTPVAGASISRSRGDESGRQKGARITHVSTDDEGRFELGTMCIERTLLVLERQEGIARQTLLLTEELDLENLLFRVPAACHMRVILDSDPGEADSIAVRDGDDKSLSMTLMAGTTTLGATVFGLQGGRSDLLRTDESACTLVLYKDGAELRRVPITLKPGEVNEIRL